jgi:hypothetical protein
MRGVVVTMAKRWQRGIAIAIAASAIATTGTSSASFTAAVP